jgi:hypothetical protein
MTSLGFRVESMGQLTPPSLPMTTVDAPALILGATLGDGSIVAGDAVLWERFVLVKGLDFRVWDSGFCSVGGVCPSLGFRFEGLGFRV